MRNLLCLSLSCIPVAAEVSIEPTLHLNAIAGVTTANDPADLISHAHDPNDNVALQGFDVGLNLEVDDWLQGFVNINVFTNADHELDAEWEEGFLKLPNLPGGLELRAGRFLNRFGLQNNKHLHAWNFADANLSTGQFLGEEGLLSEGADLTWLHEFDQGFFALTGSYGMAVAHGHEDEEEEHEEGEEEGEEEHGHEGESLENSFFADEVVTARALLSYNQTDFHQHQFGANVGFGENGFGPGRDTTLYSFDYVYTWRENGLESGGREFSAGAEWFYRDVEWMGEAGGLGSSSQSGFMAFLRYRFSDQWVTDFRYEHVTGRLAGPMIDMGELEYAFEIAERERISLALTREAQLNEDTSAFARLQYNYDDLDSGSEHSLWFQIGFNFGPGEIR